jgi:hypothetical protein
MHPVVRRSRAVVSVVLVWSAAWMLIHLPRLIVHVSGFPSSQQPTAVLHGLWHDAEWAAVSAFGFALCLLLAERGRTLRELRAWRVVLWGTLGALLLPAAQLVVAPAGYPLSDPTPALLWEVLWWSVLHGGGTALCMLWLARAQERRTSAAKTRGGAIGGSPHGAWQLTGAPSPRSDPATFTSRLDPAPRHARS